MQTIREAKIVIHLEQGRMELRAPDLSKMLADQQKQIDNAKQLEEQLKRVEAAQRAASSAGSGGGSSSGGGGGGGGTHEERDRQKILDIMEQEEQALTRLRSSMAALAGAAASAGEGFFRLARAAALLGASDESLQQIIKSLAQVQAYWDLFAGSLKIIQAVTMAQKALAAAQASYVAALAASTLATQVFTVALVEALAALVAFLAPFVIIAAIIGAAIIAAIAVWDALTESEEEATEAAKAHAEAVQAATQKTLDAIQSQIAMEQELNKLRRERMEYDAMQASLRGDRGDLTGRAGSLYDQAIAGDPAAEKQRLEAAKELAMQAAALDNEALAAAMKQRDAQVDITREKINQIEASEKALATAQRQLQIEEDKLRSFQAQVGALSEFERDQLINIRNRLRAGEQINQFEEEFLASKGGEGGRKAADSIRARRGAAAGFGVDFWDGTEGSGAAKDMADASEKVAEALKELAKLLGDAGSAAEAKARYEAEIKEFQRVAEEFAKQNGAMHDANVKLLELIINRLKELEQAVITG